MKFVLNVNVSPSMMAALTKLGHTAKRAKSGEPDGAILAAAVEQSAVVITRDLDFSQLVHQKNLPHAGIHVASSAAQPRREPDQSPDRSHRGRPCGRR